LIEMLHFVGFFQYVMQQQTLGAVGN